MGEPSWAFVDPLEGWRGALVVEPPDATRNAIGEVKCEDVDGFAAIAATSKTPQKKGNKITFTPRKETPPPRAAAEGGDANAAATLPAAKCTPEQVAPAAPATATTSSNSAVKKAMAPVSENWGKFPPEAFLGTWKDTLGHEVVVEKLKERNSVRATLTKESKTPKVIDFWQRTYWPWGPNDWSWVCGNGMLAWRWSSHTTLWWVTCDGRTSRWDRSGGGSSVPVSSTASTATTITTSV
eukprot:TRINITY_DN16295_c0_g1_i1.p1 TRINITY_DN16295_c0_g1~~TRINITY_DN16295_c0_g1_i1.p1  ORF type:complete len:255 (-),score=38.19 TRINITY_DN16295_c0_g1_i1:125-841(-)